MKWFLSYPNKVLIANDSKIIFHSGQHNIRLIYCMITTTRSGNDDNMEENIVTINILSTDEVYSLGKESLEQSELTIMCNTMIVWSCISAVPHSKHDYVDGISLTIIPHSKHDYVDSIGRKKGQYATENTDYLIQKRN